MVPIGRTYRAWLLVAALGLVGALSIAAAPVTPPENPERTQNTPQAHPKTQGNSEQGLSAHDRESLAVDREANGIAERANLIAEAQRSYSFWQLLYRSSSVEFGRIHASSFAYRIARKGNNGFTFDSQVNAYPAQLLQVVRWPGGWEAD